ncbi:hypothetical protein RNI52_34655 [Labrys neptuniae]|uniref:hypothetical protein n=1 Tax=Labrys neptuniae TaxID=376174 RepID=UPI0028913439|nr:hypothetical protein [Labrys neptuniae]MDT3382519.1 hypothetical protein [Labrys neptuniae]
MTEPSPTEAITLGIAAAAIVEYAGATPKQRKEILAAARSIIDNLATLATLAKEDKAQ